MIIDYSLLYKTDRYTDYHARKYKCNSIIKSKNSKTS